jgi:hypothetical protein
MTIDKGQGRGIKKRATDPKRQTPLTIARILRPFLSMLALNKDTSFFRK